MALGARRWTWLLVLPVLVSLVTLRSRAEDLRPLPEARIESARGVAMGTGSRAAAASTQALADNPANLVLGGLYHLEAFSAYQPTFHRFGYGASVVDSMTSKLAMGAAVRGLAGDNKAGSNSGYEGKVGLAVPVMDMLSLGIAGRYVHYTLSDPHAVPEHPVMAGQRPDQSFKLKGFTMDAAATLRPISGLSVSALGYNLVDKKSTLAPMMVGGSVAFGTSGGLGLGGDVLVDLNTHKAFNGPKLQIGGGLEYLAQGAIPLRAGYLYDQGRQQHGISAGLGYVSQQFGLQLSLRQIIVGGSETTLFGALQYFVLQ